ncbi:uncharacterized protein LOC129802189 [Phlebotomus papatasi]|uniref:uncharacterized protein LOC129802189 n=1 Tax=Phlebotomus papatasi TaxID=29031 RepID=UPI0024846E73|nr:uncharacterized protein LOC129802189 [Phlebotomus papatasi]
MPLCAYFVSGKCTYGNKCHNSHVDVQQMVQAEMKAAIQGKQWPLSCFSPFKDESPLPDFLEDQSFEEVRWNFVLAKVENRLPQFQEEFKRVTTAAFEKMSKLAMPDAAVKNYLVDIYGLNGRRSRQLKAGGAFGGGFGMSSGDGGGGRSIFDRISSNTTDSSAIFGAPSGGTFGGGSVFGGGSAGSSFGAAPAPQKSIFGGQSSVFGGQTQQPAQSIFGQSQSTNSFFKPPQLGAPQAVSGGNIFSQSMQPQQPAFGAPATFTNTTTSSIFGGSSFSNTQPMSTESIFGGGSAGSFAQNPPAFGQSAPQFGQPVLAAPAFAAPAPQSVFGQPAQQAQMSGSGFGQMNIQQVQQPVQNTFPAAPQPPVQSVFGNVPPQPQPQPPVSSVFSAPSQFSAPSAPQSNPTFFVQPNPPQSTKPAHLYSKMEELTPQDLEAFRADSFELGKIPTVPPPAELCGV